jgi:hypothetical protein
MGGCFNTLSYKERVTGEVRKHGKKKVWPISQLIVVE